MLFDCKFSNFSLPLLLLLLLRLADLAFAIVCYKCDSLALEECAMSLNASELPIEDCSTSTHCVMSIVDAVTYRGCSSDTPTAGATYQKRCADNLCNRGVYPPGRLKCHHCAGAPCAEQPTGKPHPCRWHHELDACYMEVVADLSATYRGCASDTNRTTVADSDIAYCDINACNDAPALATLACAQCDSEQQPGCKTNLFEAGATKCNITQYAVCTVRASFKRPGSCFVYHNLDRVARGCLDAASSDDPQVSVCAAGDLCNTGCVPQQRCVTCDSASSSKCLTEAGDLAVTICGSAEASSCFACEYAERHVRRGCGPPPPVSELPDRNRCFECDGGAADKCNAAPFTRCYQCTSTANTNCATWDRPGFDVTIEECEQPGARCVRAVFAEDAPTTLRGCESEQLHCNETLSACVTCDGSFCNTGQFPAHSLRCHQCSNCPSVRGWDAVPCSPQLNVVAGASEACYEYRSPEGVMRGCRSNSAQYFQCVHQNANTAAAGCRVCHTDGCNNGSLTAAPTLSCYTCRRGDLNCQHDQRIAGAGTLQRCQVGAPMGHRESCFVTRHLDGTTTRGCTWDLLASSPAHVWDQTSYCSHAAGCNSLATRSQYCIRCAMYMTGDFDDTSPACAHAAYELEPVLCSSTTDVCYVALKGFTFSRGCSSDLTSVQYEHCRNNNECFLCHGQLCNAMGSFLQASQIISRQGSGGSSPLPLTLIYFTFACIIYQMRTFIYSKHQL